MYATVDLVTNSSLENDSPSRGRKHPVPRSSYLVKLDSLENDSPSRGRKRNVVCSEHILPSSWFRK